MLEGLPKGSRVLDVGAASGMLARLCAGRGYYMRGIEPKADWLGDGRDLYAEMYAGSLEQTPDAFLEGNAALVCGDVLEHLVKPADQLRRLVATQTDGCLIIVSVPNIANIWVRLNLLLGRFDYSDRGILDRTHLHFYTRKSFLNLLQNAGLEVKKMQVTPIPMDLVDPFFVQNFIGRGLYAILTQLTIWWPTMLGYQWVAKAYKLKQ